MKNVIYCFDVFLDSETNKFFGEVWTYNRKTKEQENILTTENFTTAGQVKNFVRRNYGTDATLVQDDSA